MRLRRIEADRYGALANATLGDLADGLTVVHGPNEAGKSTYTALVRHVLYRYPTARDSEPGYAVSGDGRCARLVFDDAEGSWAVERTEGTHGGRVSVRSLSGNDRPALLEDITRGVSELAYRMVFGFGLGDMAAIEEQRESKDSIIARLYAASAGLRISPQEVRAAVDREAAELYKAAGRKPALNALIAGVRSTRGELRELRSEADLFMADQARLKGMEEQLAELRAVRDAARERCTALAVAVERADEKLAAIAAEDEALLGLRRERKQLEEEGARFTVDESLLAAAPEIDALLDEAAGHVRAMQSLAESEAALVRAQTRAVDALTRTGLDAAVFEALGDVHELTAAVEQAREELQKLHLQREAREESARREADAAQHARAVLSRLTAPLGIIDDVPEAIAERLAALDAVESLRGGASNLGRRGVDVPALIMLASGIIAVVTGAVLREWVTVGIGVVLVIAGAVFTLRSRPGSPIVVSGDERHYLDMLGLDASAGALEISRARRALDAARVAELASAAADRVAEDASRETALVADALETRQALWSQWLAAHALDTSLVPAAAAALFSLVREARGAGLATEEVRQAHAHAVGQLDGFAARFAAAARPYLSLPDTVSRDDVPALANRLKEQLASARSARTRRDEGARAMTTVDSRVATEEARAARAREELLDVLVRFDLADGGTHEDLRVLRAAAQRDDAEAAAAFDELAQAKHQLEGRLETGARERRSGELHLEEAGLTERLGESLDRYLVLSVASRLVGEAQERYQKERQPDVVKHASRLFTTMTGGRYVGLSVPLGEGRIEVFDARAAAYTSDILSRGTAEQLYLAIRLGLIAQLGEVGQGLPVLMDDVLVNFDPVRRRGAAEAIAELASERQVVFFTCHPDTADLFAEVAPRHTRLDIPRLGT